MAIVIDLQVQIHMIVPGGALMATGHLNQSWWQDSSDWYKNEYRLSIARKSHGFLEVRITNNKNKYKNNNCNINWQEHAWTILYADANGHIHTHKNSN